MNQIEGLCCFIKIPNEVHKELRLDKILLPGYLLRNICMIVMVATQLQDISGDTQPVNCSPGVGHGCNNG